MVDKVNKVNDVSSYEYIYPNTTFDAEWDVIAQIVVSVEALGRDSTDSSICGGAAAEPSEDTTYLWSPGQRQRLS
jgi:hypothetical protein